MLSLHTHDNYIMGNTHIRCVFAYTTHTHDKYCKINDSQISYEILLSIP